MPTARMCQGPKPYILTGLLFKECDPIVCSGGGCLTSMRPTGGYCILMVLRAICGIERVYLGIRGQMPFFSPMQAPFLKNSA